MRLRHLIFVLLALVAATPSAKAQQRQYSTFISSPEPLANCVPGAQGIEMPVVWDVTAATFKFCSGLNTWSSWPGGGGGGGVTSVGLLVNGGASSGIFAITGSPITLSGNLNFNLTGNLGGLPYFSTSSILTSSGTLTANLPVIGGGAGGAPTVGSRSGNTTEFATFNGAATAGRCVDTDANGNLQITAQDCNTTPGSIQTNGTNNISQLTLNFVNAGVFSWTNPSGGNESLNFASQSANTFMAAPNGSVGVPSARLIVAADIPAGTSCASNLFTTGLGAALASICVQPSFSNLLGTISLAQTVLTTNGDLLSVSAGALARVASAGGQDFLLQGANAAVPVWLAVNNCGSGTQALSYSTTTHSFGCQTITVGTGTINNATQYSAAYYSAAGSANTISGVTAPTTPSVPFILTSTPSGGVATAPTWSLPGVPLNAQTGASYTIVAADRENLDTMSNSGAIAVTLPQAGSAGFTNNFNFALANIGVGLVTITPGTSTINGNATQIVPDHWLSYIYSDNTNYRSGTFPDIAAFANTSAGGLAETFNSTTGAFGTIAAGVSSVSGDGTIITNSASVGAVTLTIAGTSGGVPCFGSATSWKSSALLALNAVVIGGGAGACPTASTALPNGTAATTQASGDSSTDVATDAFVSAAISGVNPAVAVQAATTQASDTSGFTYANGVSGIGATFTGSVNTAITIDGFTFTALGQRLLVKNDTQSPSGAFNGIYSLTVLQTVAVAPVLTRALDYDAPSDINNTGAIPVISGTANGSTSWVETAQIVTVGTTPLAFTQFSLAPTSIVTLTGIQTLSNKTLTAPVIGAATGTSLLVTSIVDGTAPVIVTTGTTGSPGATYNHSYSFNEEATAGTGVTYTLPTAAAGKQYCVANAYNGSNPNTGVLTVATSASGQFVIFTDGTLSATGGNVTSGGAADDAACFIGVDATHWFMYVQSGTWTKH